jgi:hypothetical protein
MSRRPADGLHVFVKRTDIYGCDAHERINAHQSLFVNGFDSICIVHNGFRSGQPECREMATVRIFHCSNGQ